MGDAGQKSEGFREDIQGLRAVAIGLVLAYHAGLPFATGGYVGVDVFFVISGFLITGHLVRERAREGRIALGAFFARRVRRILPAALLFAILTLAASALLLPATRLAEVARDAVATALFVPNVWFARLSDDYLAGDATSPYLHYWSLGVEEQFYLIWPVLLIGVLAIRRRGALIAALTAVAVLSLVACLSAMTVSPTWAFYLLPTRAWEFAAGALVAVVLTRSTPRLAGPWGALAGWGGMAAIAVAAVWFGDSTPFPGPAALLPVVGTALVLAAPTLGRGGPARALSLPPFQFLGLISFSLYLAHWPALVLAAETLGVDDLPVRIGVLVCLLAVPAAWMSHRLVERPFQRVGRGSAPARALVAGVVAVALVAGSGFVASTLAPVVRVDAGRAAPADDIAPDYVPSDLTPTLAAAERDRAALYDDGCHVAFRESDWQDCRFGVAGAPTTVALFGDSHAASWFPALELAAEELGFELRTFTKSACPASRMATTLDGVPDTWCADWREDVIAELRASPPDLIVIADHFGNVPDGTGLEGEWHEGVADTVRQLIDIAPVVVFADVPRFEFDPVDCLGRHLEDALACGRAPEDVLPEATNARVGAAVEALGGYYADFTSHICEPDFCPAIRGRLLVYRDSDHLTATFSESLAPLVGATIADLLTARS